MKSRRVVVTPGARADLLQLFGRLLDVAEPVVAYNYLKRVETFIEALGAGSERGTVRDEIARGLRVIGFERRLAIAFRVYTEDVVILRVFAGGQNWKDAMMEDQP